MNIALFEDEKYRYFQPLTYTRPVYELRLGLYSLRERVSKYFGDIRYLFTREYLKEVYKEFLENKKLSFEAVNPKHELDDILLINGRLVMSKDFADLIKEKVAKAEEFAIFKGKTLIVAKFKKIEEEKLELLINQNITEIIKALPFSEIFNFESAETIDYPWELIKENNNYLKQDIEESSFKNLEEPSCKCSLYGSLNKVFVGENAVLEDFIILDTRNGPILIDDSATVKAFSVIKGPTYIGKYSVITEFTKVREGSNIGEHCRIGGEVVNIIMHGFANTVHEGFVGRSYIGEWVNLGAATVTSDLKNTFGTVKMELDGKRVDTGLRKLGSFIGDMAKTAIGTKIYTGKKIGVAAQLYGIVSTDVPSFTIYAKTLGAKPIEVYLDSVIKSQRKMMASRGMTMTKNYEELIKRLFRLTESERSKFGVKKGVFRL